MRQRYGKREGETGREREGRERREVERRGERDKRETRRIFLPTSLALSTTPRRYSPHYFPALEVKLSIAAELAQCEKQFCTGR